MITYRNFLNTDPPALVDIWQQQPACRSLAQVVSRKVLDQMVFAKPYFDPSGLTIAFAADAPVGFIHLGFAPNASLNSVDHSQGIVSQLQVVDREDAAEIALGLWEHAKEYFRRHGAKTIWAGSKFPYAPFYTGLYGGSRIPGVPDEDLRTNQLLTQIGFCLGDSIDVMQINLTGFRPPVNRAQMSVRRGYQVSAIVDPLLQNWWECCTYGWAEIFGFRIVDRSSSNIVGRVMFWDIQPISTQWGTSTMGLVDLRIEDRLRQQGLATFLICESLRHLATQGVSCVEFQMRSNDQATIALAEKIGFQKTSQGSEMSISLDR